MIFHIARGEADQRTIRVSEPLSLTEAAPPWGRIERLLPAEIAVITTIAPIAYLPWGALEYHGQHAAIGLDSLKAHALCVALAQEVGGLVYPAVNLGANTIKTAPDLDFPRHSIDFTERALRLVAREYLAQLANEGYRAVFVLCGHVGQPHYDILKKEARRAGKRFPQTTFIASSECDLVSPDLFVVNHAALGEISLLMASDPECVDLSRLPSDHEPTLADDAVWGPDPRVSSAELGRRFTNAFVEAAAPLLRPFLSSESPS
jgi:creatinine amidohydrolase